MAKKSATTSKRKTAAKGAKASSKSSSTKKSSAEKTPLKKAELKKFKEMLLAKRRDLVGDLNGMEYDSNASGSTLPTHPADLGSDNYETEFNLGLRQSERTVLREIDEALDRIEEGTYGICQGTGKPIGKPRLEARPWAKYSIEYARMVEKGLVVEGETVFDDQDEDEDGED